MANKKTVIVNGCLAGHRAAVVQAFLDRGYNVIATSRSWSQPSGQGIDFVPRD